MLLKCSVNLIKFGLSFSLCFVDQNKTSDNSILLKSFKSIKVICSAISIDLKSSIDRFFLNKNKK